jgi:ABC-type transporter Mla subunit MlaD
MTEQRETADAPVNGDLGEAITQLQGAMHRLNDDSASLGEATAELQESTRALSETQAEISRQTAEVADRLRERDSRRSAAPEPSASPPVAGD